MKTERLTLLVSPDDKAMISERAAALGVSTSELVRRATMAFEPEDQVAMAELEALMPEFNAAIGRIEANLASALASSEAHEREMDYLRSPEYRDQVRRELAEDETINWDAVRRTFGFIKQDDAA